MFDLTNAYQTTQFLQAMVGVAGKAILTAGLPQEDQGDPRNFSKFYKAAPFEPMRRRLKIDVG